MTIGVLAEKVQKATVMLISFSLYFVIFSLHFSAFFSLDSLYIAIPSLYPHPPLPLSMGVA